LAFAAAIVGTIIGAGVSLRAQREESNRQAERQREEERRRREDTQRDWLVTCQDAVEEIIHLAHAALLARRSDIEVQVEAEGEQARAQSFDKSIDSNKR